METTDKLRAMTSAEAETFARELYENDINVFINTVVDLTRCGGLRDSMLIARMLSVIPIEALLSDAQRSVYLDSKINAYLELCERGGLSLGDCMPVLFSAQYAPHGSRLYAWDKSFDKYIRDMAQRDFEQAAELIDSYDSRYGKYNALIQTDKPRALERLVALAIYGKNTDRSAIRDFLMDYAEISGFLMSLYKKVSVHERVAVVRLLSVYKNDPKVRDFIVNTVANDSSKTVRELVSGGYKSTEKRRTAAAYIEGLMAAGKPLTYSEWNKLLENSDHIEVAERVFFYHIGKNGGINILVYDGGSFLNIADETVRFEPDEKIYVLHPLDLPYDPNGIFKADIDQPFLQIKRPVFSRLSGEHKYSERLDGTVIPYKAFCDRLKKQGFVIASKRKKSENPIAVCVVGDYAVGIECFVSPNAETATSGRMYYYNASDIVKIKRKIIVSASQPLNMTDIDARSYSELTYKAYLLFE